MDNVTIAAAKTIVKVCVDKVNNAMERITAVEEKISEDLEPITAEEIKSLFTE